MIPRIQKIETLDNFCLKVEFDDKKVVIYDLKEDMNNLPGYSDLGKINGLFKQVQLDESRTCVYWNQNIDLPSDTIYEYGIELNILK